MFNISKIWVCNGKLYAPCGVFGDAFSSPVTNFAKADHLRRWKPARMAYTACCSALFYFSVRSLIS